MVQVSYLVPVANLSRCLNLKGINDSVWDSLICNLASELGHYCYFPCRAKFLNQLVFFKERSCSTTKVEAE